MALDTTIGGAASDSYGTLAAYQAYAVNMGWTLEDTDGKDEANLRRAAMYLDRKYDFIGLKQYQFQARSWPRLVRDLADDWPINPDTVPGDIVSAQFEVAYLLQGGLNPFATIETSKTKDMIKVGPITIDEGTLPTSTPRIVAVEGLLRSYIKAGVGQLKMVRG